MPKPRPPGIVGHGPPPQWLKNFEMWVLHIVAQIGTRVCVEETKGE